MHKFLCALTLGCLLALPAQAHKVVASAWTDGKDIEGEVGFSNGDMALPDTVIEVFDSENNKIGETKITEDGLFRFTPATSIAHTFSANLGAGHVASVVVPVDELPDGLKAGPARPMTAKQEATKTSISAATNDEIAKIVAKAVRKEVQPLRKEIAQYKEKNDLQSILGGIGYILGLTGIVFYIAARRKESQNK